MAARDEQHMYSLPYDRVPMESNNYNDLINKPSVNGHALVGDKTTAELGITIPTKTSDLTNDSEFTTKTYVDDEIDTIENKISLLDGISFIKNFNVTATFTSTFDNLATALTTALTAIQTALLTDEFVEIKSLNIATIGNLKPLNLVTIDENTNVAGLNIDWQGVSYVNNVLKAIDIVNKRVLSLTMTNDRNNDEFVSYFQDTDTFNFTIYYTKYGTFNV